MLPGLGFGPGGGPITYGYGSFIKKLIQAIANICRTQLVRAEARIEKIEPDC
jgi:hypothetical protein